MGAHPHVYSQSKVFSSSSSSLCPLPLLLPLILLLLPRFARSDLASLVSEDRLFEWLAQASGGQNSLQSIARCTSTVRAGLPRPASCSERLVLHRFRGPVDSNGLHRPLVNRTLCNRLLIISFQSPHTWPRVKVGEIFSINRAALCGTPRRRIFTDPQP